MTTAGRLQGRLNLRLGYRSSPSPISVGKLLWPAYTPFVRRQSRPLQPLETWSRPIGVNVGCGRSCYQQAAATSGNIIPGHQCYSLLRFIGDATNPTKPRFDAWPTNPSFSNLHHNPPHRYDRGTCSLTPTKSATHSQISSDRPGEAMRERNRLGTFSTSCLTNDTYGARAAGTTMTAYMKNLSLDLRVALGLIVPQRLLWGHSYLRRTSKASSLRH